MKTLKELGLEILEINKNILLIDKHANLEINDWVYSMDGIHQWFGLILTTEPLPVKIIAATPHIDNIPNLIIQEFTKKELRFIYDTAIVSTIGILNHDEEFENVLKFLNRNLSIETDNDKIKIINNTIYIHRL